MPGASHCNAMYEQLRAIAEEAKEHGLAVVVWSYPRGSVLNKEGETAMDVVAYAAQIAAQLGAHVIKVKLPSAHLEQSTAKRSIRPSRFPLRRWWNGSNMWSRVRSMVVGSSSFQAVPRARIGTYSKKLGPFGTVAASARSSAGTHSSVRRRRQSSSSTPSWEFMPARFSNHRVSLQKNELLL